jgi:hypothetical protein
LSASAAGASASIAVESAAALGSAVAAPGSEPGVAIASTSLSTIIFAATAAIPADAVTRGFSSAASCAVFVSKCRFAAAAFSTAS